MDVGTTLRTAREQRGLSVADVAHATKIGTAQLRAIERNAFHTLPAGIVVRGFLRAYAREVGLDPETIVRQFTDSAREADPARRDAAHATSEAEAPVSDQRSGIPFWVYALLALLLLSVFYYSRGRDPELAMSPPSPAEEETSPDAAEEGDAGVVPASGGVPLPGDPTFTADPEAVATDGRLVLVEIAPHGECWVEVVADGRQIVRRLMQSGDRERIEVGRDVTILAGDPATFAFSIDGRPGRSFGRPYVPATLRFTIDDYERLLD